MMGHHGWMNTGTLLASTLYGAWCTMNFSRCCMCWHPSHLIHRCMCDVGSSLLKQASKRITFILDRHHLKDLPWVDGRKLQHFHQLPWTVYDVSWVSTIHTGVDTTLNSYMSTWVRLIHHCSSTKIRESHPYWPHSITNIDHYGWQNTKALS